MVEKIFRGLFDGEMATVISVADFLLCVGSALLIGLILAFMCSYRTRMTRSFPVTLAVLPAVVCVVIMMVNGNVGTGVAVAGAFSLVRFRSAPGSGREIAAIFLAMGAGLIAGMGYIGYAFLFALLVGGMTMIYAHVDLGAGRRAAKHKSMRITIPEDLDYSGIFDDLFAEYTTACELVSVKTTNMGSLFRLTYDLVLRDPAQEKEFIDKLRCRNGNLEISIGCQASSGEL